MFARIIRISYYLLFILVPLVFLSITSELFEFNKIIITYLLTVVIVTAWAARMITAKKWIFRRTLLDLPLLLFLVINLLSLVFSIDMHTSWFGYYSRWNGGLLSLISYSLLYWAFVSNMDAKATLRTLHLALGTSILVALWGVAEHFGADASIWVQDVQNRVFSTLGQPNWLAAYLVALIFVPISMLLNSQFTIYNLKSITKSQLINFSLFILLFCVLLFTKSRSGLLAFGISGAVCGLIWLFAPAAVPPLKVSGGKGGVMSVLGLVLASVVALTIVIPNPLRDLIFKNQESSVNNQGGTVLEVGGTESGSIRKIVWTGAIRIWQGSAKNFWLGTGPETFGMAYYQYRPIEHNQTSEWELLYNKAHNEYLNYLATTGILGLGSYLLLLAIMLGVQCSVFRDKKLDTSHRTLVTALFAGWSSIIVTNFLGFSVVIVQLLMFLLPAMAITLELQSDKVTEEQSSVWPWIFFVTLSLAGFVTIGRYWLADVDLAAAQKQTKYFQSTQTPQYLVEAYTKATNAYKLNSGEPVIASELSNSAAYLALALPAESTSSAQQLAQISLATSQQAIDTSPFHPNYYKSRARSLILLSDYNTDFLAEAAKTLEAAVLISPTDPRLPYNLGVVYKYLNKTEAAKAMFEKSLQLKPDFADPKEQLKDL